MKCKLHFEQLGIQLLDVLFPRLCIICKNPMNKLEEEMCISCELNLPLLNDIELKEFVDKIWLTVEIKEIESLLAYSKRSSAQVIFKEIKYYKNQKLAFKMGQIFGRKILAKGKNNFDLIIPVPLHKKKLLSRGFNQSAIIAKGVSDILKIESPDKLVKREKNTISQTKLDREERWENVQNVFSISNPELIRGKNIALLDDVITTGATLNSLAEALNTFGPKSISYLSLACPI